MAIKIGTSISNGLHNKMSHKLVNDGMTESEYLINLITDDLFPELNEKEAVEEKVKIASLITSEDVGSDEITDIFVALLGIMSADELDAAKRIIDHLQGSLDIAQKESTENTKRKGIYQMPKEKAEPSYNPDNMGVSEEAAENLISEQEEGGDDENNSSDDGDVDAFFGAESDDVQNYEESGEGDGRHDSNEEEDYADDIDEIERRAIAEYQKVLDEEISSPSKEEMQEAVDSAGEEVAEKVKAGILAKPSKQEIKKYSSKKNVEAEVEEALGGRIDTIDEMDDPDSDTPNWGDGIQEIHDQQAGIDNSVSDKAFNSIPMSEEIKPKPARKLKYDPTNANKSSILVGPYANTKNRVKTKSSVVETAQGANFLKTMEVPTTVISQTIKKRGR